jgi:hypothetical protein
MPPSCLSPRSGEFTVVNQHLLHDLTRMSMWNPLLKNELVAANGSVQHLDMPEDLKVRGRAREAGTAVSMLLTHLQMQLVATLQQCISARCS